MATISLSSLRFWEKMKLLPCVVSNSAICNLILVFFQINVNILPWDTTINYIKNCAPPSCVCLVHLQKLCLSTTPISSPIAKRSCTSWCSSSSGCIIHNQRRYSNTCIYLVTSSKKVVCDIFMAKGVSGRIRETTWCQATKGRMCHNVAKYGKEHI